MVPSNVANFEMSSSLGCTLANSTVPEFSESCPAPAGDNLLEGIKRIECVSRDTGLRVGGCVGWFRAWRNRRMRRNSQYGLTLRFERTACRRRQFVMRFHVLIKGI